MLVCEGNASVDKGAGGENRTGLLGSRFEGELGEEGGSGVVGEGHVVDFGGALVYGADDEFTNSRGVLEKGGVLALV